MTLGVALWPFQNLLCLSRFSLRIQWNNPWGSSPPFASLAQNKHLPERRPYEKKKHDPRFLEEKKGHPASRRPRYHQDSTAARTEPSRALGQAAGDVDEIGASRVVVLSERGGEKERTRHRCDVGFFVPDQIKLRLDFLLDGKGNRGAASIRLHSVILLA